MIIFYIMIVTIAGTDGKSRLTDRCPSSILQWKRQETLFSCPAGAPYHCILKYNTSQLYEACIATVMIGPGVVGCPWILFHQGVPVHGSRNSECPISNPECPPANHKGYLSNQIYLYPACFMQRSARSSHGITSEPPRTVKAGKSNHTSEREDTNESQRNMYIALGLSAVVVVIVISSVVFCLFKRVTSTLFATRWQEEDETIDMNKTGQLIQEIGNGTIQCTNEEEAVHSSNGNGTAECINEKEKLISSNDEDTNVLTACEKDTKESQIDVSTSIKDSVLQRFLQPTSEEKESDDWSGEDEKDSSTSEPNRQKNVRNEDNRKDSKEAEPNGLIKVCNEDNRKDSNEDNVESDPTCYKEKTLNRHTITLYERGDSDEEVVQRVFRSILEISDGVVSYQQLLMYFVQKEDCSDINKNLENILKENRNVFRLLEDESICFVIAYMSNADICENYNPSSLAGECVDPNCSKFHICSFYVKSLCRNSQCKLSHKYEDRHNMRVKNGLRLSRFTDKDINKIILNQYPKICSASGCDREESCPYLHVCSTFCYGKCPHKLKCRFGHSFRTDHNAWILKAYGISEDEIWSGSPITRKFILKK